MIPTYFMWVNISTGHVSMLSCPLKYNSFLRKYRIHLFLNFLKIGIEDQLQRNPNECQSNSRLTQDTTDATNHKRAWLEVDNLGKLNVLALESDIPLLHLITFSLHYRVEFRQVKG